MQRTANLILFVWLTASVAVSLAWGRTDGTTVATGTRPIIVPPAEPNVIDVDPTELPMLHPVAVTDAQNLPTLKRGFGIVDPPVGFSYRFDQNPNPIYQKTHPFPEIDLEPIVPSMAWGVSGNHTGLNGIEAYHRSWLWPCPPNTNPKEERQTLWRWKAPDTMQERMLTWTPAYGSEHYSVVCVYDGYYEHKRRAPPSEPLLLYIDALTGIRWQTTLPVESALAGVADTKKLYSSDRNTDVQVGLIADGSRVLALVSRPDKAAALLFIFDGSGKLQKTFRFLNYTAMPSTTSWHLPRTPAGRGFLIHLTCWEIGAPEVTFLVDTEGRMSAQFVNDKEQSVQVRMLTDTHAIAFRAAPNGSYIDYIYQLP